MGGYQPAAVDSPGHCSSARVPCGHTGERSRGAAGDCSADERSADERSADERSADERSTDERSAGGRAQRHGVARRCRAHYPRCASERGAHSPHSGGCPGPGPDQEQELGRDPGPGRGRGPGAGPGVCVCAVPGPDPGPDCHSSECGSADACAACAGALKYRHAALQRTPPHAACRLFRAGQGRAIRRRAI